MIHPNHLSDVEFVDYLDGVLPPARAAHVARCERCRAQAESLDGAWLETRDAGIPEPSPLFWEHFSARVRDAVNVEPAAARQSRWLRAPVWAAAAIVIIVVVLRGDRPIFRPPSPIVVTDVADSRPAPGPAPGPARGPAPGPAPGNDEQPVGAVNSDLETDDEWALVRAVADDLHWDSAQEAGLAAQPGSAERVALEMSAAERREFARLIGVEMKQSGS